MIWWEHERPFLAIFCFLAHLIPNGVDNLMSQKTEGFKNMNLGQFSLTSSKIYGSLYEVITPANCKSDSEGKFAGLLARTNSIFLAQELGNW